MTTSWLLIFIQCSFVFIFIECPAPIRGYSQKDKIYQTLMTSTVFLRAWDGPMWVIEGGESQRIQLIVWKLRAYFKWNLFDRITAKTVVALNRDMWTREGEEGGDHCTIGSQADTIRMLFKGLSFLAFPIAPKAFFNGKRMSYVSLRKCKCQDPS